MSDYRTEKLIAGDIKTQLVKFAANTYHRGMPVKYDSSNDRYEYDATAATIAGFFLEEERIISANGWGTIIAPGSTIYEGGIVDDSGDDLTIDEDFIAAVAVRGFHVKRI